VQESNQQEQATRAVLLGPQRFDPSLSSVLDSLGVRGRIAVVTAGWQEREHEVDELQEHLNREVVNLYLYRRGEEIEVEDRELAAGLRERQELLLEHQQVYRQRLSHALDAARELIAREGRQPALVLHRRAAIIAVRTLDRQHLVQLQRVHQEFLGRFAPALRPAVQRQREQLRKTLAGAGVLAIAGGHVAVLLNRLRLFGLLSMLEDRPVVAWSAGAMALSERVILFHDSPPQGPGNAEVFDAGLGLFPDVVPLPDARHRLRLDDPGRVSLFARRFAPAHCVVLDEGSRLDWNGQTLSASGLTRRLARAGGLAQMGPT
jgi:hypothetical protein